MANRPHNWVQIFKDILDNINNSDVSEYHPEWHTGVWSTNCSSVDDFRILYVEGGTLNKYGGKGYDASLNPDKDYMMGPPGGTETGHCSTPVEALIKMGSVGVYVRDKVPEDPLLVIANDIREGVLSSAMRGQSWALSFDSKRVDGNELTTVLNNIADCIASGVTKGICPFWELKR